MALREVDGVVAGAGRAVEEARAEGGRVSRSEGGGSCRA